MAPVIAMQSRDHYDTVNKNFELSVESVCKRLGIASDYPELFPGVYTTSKADVLWLVALKGYGYLEHFHERCHEHLLIIRVVSELKLKLTNTALLETRDLENQEFDFHSSPPLSSISSMNDIFEQEEEVVENMNQDEVMVTGINEEVESMNEDVEQSYDSNLHAQLNVFLNQGRNEADIIWVKDSDEQLIKKIVARGVEYAVAEFIVYRYNVNDSINDIFIKNMSKKYIQQKQRQERVSKLKKAGLSMKLFDTVIKMKELEEKYPTNTMCTVSQYAQQFMTENNPFRNNPKLCARVFGD